MGERGWCGASCSSGLLKNNRVLFSRVFLQQRAQGSLGLEGVQLCSLKEHLCIFKIQMPPSSSPLSELVKEHTHLRLKF